MGLYDINFQQVTEELYPVNKRLPNLLAWADSVFSPLQFMVTLLTYYRTGATCGNFNSATVYTYGQMVIWQRRVYAKNEVTSGYIANTLPNNTAYWDKVLDDFIGMNEKSYFGPVKLVLEYALNRIFQTTFRQPYQPFLMGTVYAGGTQVVYNDMVYQRNFTTAGYVAGTLPTNTTYWTFEFTRSDIYITNNATNADYFYIGIDDAESATICVTDSDADYAISVDDGNPSIKDMTIWVPNAVLASLASAPSDQQAIISSVVNRYKLSGYLFNVQGY